MATRDKWAAEGMADRKPVKLSNGAWTTVPLGLSAAEERAEVQRQEDNFTPYERPAQAVQRAELAIKKMAKRAEGMAERRRLIPIKARLLETGEITMDDLQRLAEGKNPELAERLANEK